MRTLLLLLALAFAAPAGAQIALITDGPDGLTLESVGPDGLSPKQERAVEENRAAVVGRTGDGWCLGCRSGDDVARLDSLRAQHDARMARHREMMDDHRDRLRRLAEPFGRPARPVPPARPAPLVFDAEPASTTRVRYEVTGGVESSVVTPDFLRRLAALDGLVGLSATDGGTGFTRVSALFSFDGIDAWTQWAERAEVTVALAPLVEAERGYQTELAVEK